MQTKDPEGGQVLKPQTNLTIFVENFAMPNTK